MKARHFLILALAIVVSPLACSDPGEYAEFETAQLQALPDCMADEFPFQGSLLSARERDGRVGIFLKKAPDVTSKYDVVYFEIYDPDAVAVGDPVELGDAGFPPPVARGRIQFFSSCAHEHHSMRLGGALVFDSFDYEAHGVVSGHLVDGHIIDDRTNEVIVDDLNGEWHFAVRLGPPYEEFYALPERP